MEKYPLPDYAVSVWVAGDNLMVAFPGTVTEQGHTIKLPASPGGLHAAITIMKQRARDQSLFIGERGTPTQYEMETALSSQDKYKEWLKAMGEDREAKAAAARELQELGL